MTTTFLIDGVDPALVDEVVLGSANQAGEDNRNVARMAWLLAGLPDSVPGFTVNRLCASGLTAIATARQMIASGDADLVVAGGVESMTRAPWVQEKPARAWAKPGAAFDTSIGWRFTNPAFDAETTLSMPQTAERVAERWGLGRDELDAIALGHPLGSSGTRLVVPLLGRLERSGGRRGLATMCVGVGQGSALLLERV